MHSKAIRQHITLTEAAMSYCELLNESDVSDQIMSKEDFYIGYLPKMPVRSGRSVKLFLIAVFCAVLAAAALIWIGQKPFARSVFEFGNVREFRGTIRAGAVPFLIVERDSQNGGLPDFERIPLVAEGKHGAAVGAFDSKRVALRGTLIYRDDLKMIEIADGALEIVDSETPKSEGGVQSLGQYTLRGEIVDSKCHLGVMNPGQSKPHRDCAVACIRGGIPPLFIAKDVSGNVSEMWLVGPSGGAIGNDLLEYVAEPVEITGRVERRDDQLLFFIDPANVKRLT